MGTSMRALIRNVKTGMFYGSDGRWTAEREDARDFGGTYQAISFAGQNSLRGVHVVLAFDAPEYDAVIDFERGRQLPSPDTQRGDTVA
jgi:hypothetical protein